MNVEDIEVTDLEERMTYSLGSIEFVMDSTLEDDVKKINITFKPKKGVEKIETKITILPSGKSSTSSTGDLF